MSRRARGEPQKPPAFQLYAKAWLSSTLSMSHAVKGAYIDLLCWSWDNGPVPLSAAMRARLLGLEAAAAARIWAALRPKFIQTDAGWINARLEAQRRELEAYQSKAQTAAKARWHGANTDDVSIAQASFEHVLNGCTPTPSPKEHIHRRRTPPVNRAPFRVYAAIATQAFADEPSGDLGAIAERAKQLCADQGHTYNAEILGRALRAAERGQRRKAEERG